MKKFIAQHRRLEETIAEERRQNQRDQDRFAAAWQPHEESGEKDECGNEAQQTGFHHDVQIVVVGRHIAHKLPHGAAPDQIGSQTAAEQKCQQILVPNQSQAILSDANSAAVPFLDMVPETQRDGRSDDKQDEQERRRPPDRWDSAKSEVPEDGEIRAYEQHFVAALVADQ